MVSDEYTEHRKKLRAEMTALLALHKSMKWGEFKGRVNTLQAQLSAVNAEFRKRERERQSSKPAQT